MSTPLANFKQSDMDKLFLTSPGEDIVPKLLMQLSAVPTMKALFGSYKSDDEGNKSTDQQRWADYNRMDWAVRQLPAINVFESGSESKESENGFVNGTISIQVFWPPAFRRGQTMRVPAAFKGAMQDFFISNFCSDMLDELYHILRPMKVSGLNELGKHLNWSPNVEGFVANELVPATILEVNYRIDLRAWYRTLEYQGRTKANPFVADLADLTGIQGLVADGNGYQGLDGDSPTMWVTIEDRFNVNNP